MFAEGGSTIDAEPISVKATTASRRIRTLLHTAPIHALEDNKVLWGEQWGAYDMRRLQIEAVAITLDHQGLEGGLSRQSLRDEVAQIAASLAPERPRDEHQEAAERVLSHLLNEQPGSDFVYDYADRSDERWERRRHAVKLLDQHQLDDGSLVVRASNEAINLLIGSLAIDIADAQKAEERLLDEYIRAGRLDAAYQSALTARLRSIAYQNHINDRLRIIRQDITRLDWSGQCSTRSRRRVDTWSAAPRKARCATG